MSPPLRQRLLLPALIVCLLIAFWLALMLGSLNLPAAEVLGALLPGDGVPRAELVVNQLRLPRALLAMLCGATLALCGVAMQGLFRNPLADPGLIGVSSGAALGAAASILLLPLIALPDWLAPWLGMLSAFAGGLLVTLLVYRLGQRDGQTRVAVMLLAGVALSALSAALVGLCGYLADDGALRALTYWSLGSLNGASFLRLLPLLPVFALVAFWLPRRASALNALLLGESEARHLGIEVERLKIELVLCVALGVGATVAAAGMIGFVGLVVPHLLRLLTGPDHRHLLPAAALGGALLLLLADLAARLLLAPAELPIGTVTALLGAPFFLYLLSRERL